MELIQLLSAAGIGGIVGSLLTTLVQAWITRHAALDNRRFQEKKDAYIGLLEALYKSQVEGTYEASSRAGYWAVRCDLVGSESVRVLIQRLRETNSSAGQTHPDRPTVQADLEVAMRADLGIQQ